MRGHPGEPGAIARRWLGVLRSRGDHVRELLRDGPPTACAEDAAFADVDVFKAHFDIGFFRGAEIADPERLPDGEYRLRRDGATPGTCLRTD